MVQAVGQKYWNLTREPTTLVCLGFRPVATLWLCLCMARVSLYRVYTIFKTIAGVFVLFCWPCSLWVEHLRQPFNLYYPKLNCNGAQGHYCNSHASDMLEVKRAFFCFFLLVSDQDAVLPLACVKGYVWHWYNAIFKTIAGVSVLKLLNLSLWASTCDSRLTCITRCLYTAPRVAKLSLVCGMSYLKKKKRDKRKKV